ncbi:hypothetical protein [Sulfidibacter corallicola]|uniref:Uncharacterized protein n=1 Tax=Sulfidibacter corallicola TaxID=2818388 RepID=A0A8A4TLG5_SULCO|nr:hypothetical protein [Sulfidibacter corallicola]QTD50390.1 hypothetical protein J3U87_32805 [Sulfidibacter corallicola]
MSDVENPFVWRKTKRKRSSRGALNPGLICYSTIVDGFPVEQKFEQLDDRRLSNFWRAGLSISVTGFFGVSPAFGGPIVSFGDAVFGCAIERDAWCMARKRSEGQGNFTTLVTQIADVASDLSLPSTRQSIWTLQPTLKKGGGRHHGNRRP